MEFHSIMKQSLTLGISKFPHKDVRTHAPRCWLLAYVWVCGKQVDAFILSAELPWSGWRAAVVSKLPPLSWAQSYHGPAGEVQW